MTQALDVVVRGLCLRRILLHPDRRADRNLDALGQPRSLDPLASGDHAHVREAHPVVDHLVRFIAPDARSRMAELGTRRERPGRDEAEAHRAQCFDNARVFVKPGGQADWIRKSDMPDPRFEALIFNTKQRMKQFKSTRNSLSRFQKTQNILMSLLRILELREQPRTNQVLVEHELLLEQACLAAKVVSIYGKRFPRRLHANAYDRHAVQTARTLPPRRLAVLASHEDGSGNLRRSHR